MGIGGLNHAHVTQYNRNRSQIKRRRKDYIDRVFDLKSKHSTYTKTSFKSRLSKQQVENNKQSDRGQMRHHQLLGWLKTIVVLIFIGILIYLLLPQISAFGQLLFR